MPVYKLEPIKGTEDHRDWLASSLSPTPVWLRANNCTHARQRMHNATKVMLASEEVAPWISTELVRCMEDPSFEVAHDKALLANGNITINLSQIGPRGISPE
jgi:hypothetical protein